ncbi:hypothetical protein AAVH_25612 [Aphelenchoides avenae]|nr:hypothetical protein AAVH_25612 [Aphelenchus avenae]
MLKFLRVHRLLQTVPAVLPAVNLRYKSSSAFSATSGHPRTLTALTIFGADKFTLYREGCDKADSEPNPTSKTVSAPNDEKWFVPARRSQFACNSMAELREWLPDYSVKRVDFDSRLVCDEALCDALSPLKDAWKRAQCYAPRNYANEASVQSVFGKLLLCDELVLAVDKLPWPERQSFFSLPAIQHCHDLTIHWLPGLRGRADELVEWLHVPCNGQRRLICGSLDCNVGLISKMVPKLIEKFSKDTEPRSFELFMDMTIFCEEDQRRMEQGFDHTEVNSFTGELLEIETCEGPNDDWDEDDFDKDGRSWVLIVQRGKPEEA